MDSSPFKACKKVSKGFFFLKGGNIGRLTPSGQCAFVTVVTYSPRGGEGGRVGWLSQMNMKKGQLVTIICDSLSTAMLMVNR